MPCLAPIPCFSRVRRHRKVKRALSLNPFRKAILNQKYLCGRPFHKLFKVDLP